MSKFIRLAISGLLLAVIAWRTEWGVVADKFANLHIALWLTAVGLLVAGQFASARRWQLFAQELRFERSLPQLTRQKSNQEAALLSRCAGEQQFEQFDACAS